MPKVSNKTERDLFRLAKLLGVPPGKGWLKRLSEEHFKVDQRVLSKWLERDRISKKGMAKIQEWGFRHEDWAYDKIPLEGPKSPPESTISERDQSYGPPRTVPYVVERRPSHREIIEQFKNKDLALLLTELLLVIEREDPEILRREVKNYLEGITAALLAKKNKGRS